jgi:hypothetical protein
MGEIVLTAINKGDKRESIEVDLPISYVGKKVETLSGKLINTDGKSLTIEVEPLSYAIISITNN